jgi:hypothetical protein
MQMRDLQNLVAIGCDAACIDNWTRELGLFRSMEAMSPVTETSLEVAAMARDRIMKLSGAERFVIGARMFESARAIVLASFPGDISETERRGMLYERFYGEPLPRGRAGD